jgi:DNA-binding response OmpR family regulator
LSLGRRLGLDQKPSEAMAKPRLLLVDDDRQLREATATGLEAQAFQVRAVASARAAFEAMDTQAFDLILLDITMPEVDGWSVLADERRPLEVPVIVLTANADLPVRIKAFQLGASDYIAKPFFIEELAARVRARLMTAPTTPEAIDTPLIVGDCIVDRARRAVTRAGLDLRLTPTEFDILAYLLARPDRAVARGALADHALPASGDRNDRTVDSHVSRLRAKLGTLGERIRTVWGIGWTLDVTDLQGPHDPA